MQIPCINIPFRMLSAPISATSETASVSKNTYSGYILSAETLLLQHTPKPACKPMPPDSQYYLPS